MRLNLASGTDIRDGWVNLDVVEKWPLARRGCDVVWDARSQAIPFPDGSANEIYAGYLLLHLAPHHHGRVLDDIRRVLRVGGRLVVGEVDMREVMRRWLADPRDARLAELVWGEQGALPPRNCLICQASEARMRHEGKMGYVMCGECLAHEEQARLADFDKHCHGYTEETLREALAAHGFPLARRINVHGPAVWYELTLEAFK